MADSVDKVGHAGAALPTWLISAATRVPGLPRDLPPDWQETRAHHSAASKAKPPNPRKVLFPQGGVAGDRTDDATRAFGSASRIGWQVGGDLRKASQSRSFDAAPVIEGSVQFQAWTCLSPSSRSCRRWIRLATCGLPSRGRV